MRVYLALLWLTMLLLRPAAQTDGLTLSARTGFDGLYRNAAAVPILVSVRNDGAPLEGDIRVAVDDGAGGENVFIAPVSLPTQSDKRVALYVHVPGFSGRLKVELVSEGRVVATAMTDILTLSSPDTLLYGVVSADPGALAFLETVTGGRTGADVAFLDLADLPDVAIAWRALDVLIFDDVDTSRLTARQLAALHTWVENGGHLVVTGGPGGNFAIIGCLTPITPELMAVFVWRCRKVSGWQRNTWRFLYRNRLEARHWAVLEQDRVMMEQMEPNANQREHLYQHDMGLVRLRRHLRRLAQEQLDAMNP